MVDVLLVGWDDVSASEAGSDLCPALTMFRSQAHEVQGFSHPVCSQSRQAALFGSYGKKLGTWRDIGTLEMEAWTPAASLPTLPGILRSAGYATCLVGKWHCGPDTSGEHWALGPYRRGYNDWLAGTRLNLNSDPSIDYRNWERVDSFGTSWSLYQETQYATVSQRDAALEWWTGLSGERRFMHVSLSAPHAPFHHDVPSGLLAGWPAPDHTSSNRTKYRAMLRSADTVFGDLLELVGPETAVFLYSDNGTSHRAVAASVDPEHAKETTFDPGIRVLQLGRWHGCPVGPSGDLYHLVDIPAGICAAAGVIPPSEWDSRAQGRSHILSEAQFDDHLERCVRTHTMKLRQVTTGETMVEELYDLVSDPNETTPLSLEAPDEQPALTWLRGKLALGEL